MMPGRRKVIQRRNAVPVDPFFTNTGLPTLPQAVQNFFIVFSSLEALATELRDGA
jgi:hypothetical protein